MIGLKTNASSGEEISTVSGFVPVRVETETFSVYLLLFGGPQQMRATERQTSTAEKPHYSR